VKAVIDYVGSIKSSQIEKLITSIRLAQSARVKKDFFYEDFRRSLLDSVESVTEYSDRDCIEQFSAFITKNMAISHSNTLELIDNVYNDLMVPKLKKDVFYIDFLSTSNYFEAIDQKMTEKHSQK
jgi:hypothetical protein